MGERLRRRRAPAPGVCQWRRDRRHGSVPVPPKIGCLFGGSRRSRFVLVVQRNAEGGNSTPTDARNAMPILPDLSVPENFARNVRRPMNAVLLAARPSGKETLRIPPSFGGPVLFATTHGTQCSRRSLSHPRPREKRSAETRRMVCYRQFYTRSSTAREGPAIRRGGASSLCYVYAANAQCRAPASQNRLLLRSSSKRVYKFNPTNVRYVHPPGQQTPEFAKFRTRYTQSAFASRRLTA